MRVAFCAAEVFPFAKTGGLADVCGTLPYFLANEDVFIDIFMPHYRCVEDVKVEKHPCENFSAHVAHLNKYIRIFFVDHPEYFDREGLYGDAHGDYDDNFERFTYFSYETLHILEELPDRYDVIHCHDWQTGLIPTILKNKPFDYQKLRYANVLFTIHNLAYQGLFSGTLFHKLKLPDWVYVMDGIEFYDQISFLKGGIAYADTVTTVSPQYAKEIQTKKYGCGLEGVLKKRGVVGIINGLNYDYWNPSKDVYLKPPFDASTSEIKLKHKAVLQRKLGLTVDATIPLFGFVGRLSHQKGIELLLKALPGLAKRHVQVAIIGTGSKEFENVLKNVAKKYSEHIGVYLDFAENMAHLTFAASDFFLMPSNYEPCGLTQMIALRYGAIPIVAKTGGLVDTIRPYNPRDKKSSGFVMDKYTLKAFNEAVNQALTLYKKPDNFKKLSQFGFSCRFTWEESAKHYLEVYGYDSSRSNR